MKQNLLVKMRKLLKGERGQALPFVAVAMLVMVGMAGLTLDVGRVYYSNRTLQEMADAAALAGAGVLRSSTTTAQVVAAATALSGVNGSTNARASMPSVSLSSGYPALKCLTTLQSQGSTCLGTVPYNAVQVQEQIVVPMYFASLFGVSTMTTVVTATAAGRGGPPSPYNVAVIIDSSLSMASPDVNCGGISEMQCALNGLQVLLKGLNPCASSLATCSITSGVAANSVDRVALFTFPNVSAATYSRDTSCTTAVPAPTLPNGYWTEVLNAGTINYVMPYSPLLVTGVTPWSTIPLGMSYSYPTAGASTYTNATSYTASVIGTTGTATYQITPFLSDYRTSDKATTLNASSTLVQAAGAVTSCGGLAPANYAGLYGTYYAGAIYAAQAALVAQKAANPNSGNVLIILGDGDSNAPQYNGLYPVLVAPATASGSYPSWNGECGQAVVAAHYATAQGTQVYSVAYGSPVAGCGTDAVISSYPLITPCLTMYEMASTAQYFYSDYLQTGSLSVCYAGQPATSLSGIFSAITYDLSTPRLIPDNTT